MRHAIVETDEWVTSESIRDQGKYVITGLTSGVNYKWQVRAKCADESGSNYEDGQGLNFKTGTSSLDGCSSTKVPSDIIPHLRYFKLTFPISESEKGLYRYCL